MRAERRGQIWSYAVIEAEYYDGHKFKVMAVIDEFTRECLIIRVLREGTSETTVLDELFKKRSRPEQVRAYERGNPASGLVQSFIRKLRGELVASQAFGSAGEAQLAFDEWMRRYNSTLRTAIPTLDPSAARPAAAPQPARPGGSSDNGYSREALHASGELAKAQAAWPGIEAAA